MKRLSLLLGLAVLLSAAFAAPDGIPRSIDGFRVEVGPPGNEFYKPPPPPAEPQAPTPEVFATVRRLAPTHTVVSRWEFQRGSRYFIRAEAGPEEYDFLFSPDGRLLSFDYENDNTNVFETPGRMVVNGSRKGIPISEAPAATRKALQEAFPKASATEAWTIESPAGPRLVVVLDGLAFFARPDGQIQAAGPVASALKEIELKELVPPTPEEITAEAISKLGPYREKFNYEKQLARLPKPGSSFRFVMMGDSRSNPPVWGAIIKHINSLDPKPAFIINSGDLVQRGYTQEYLDYFLPPYENVDVPFFVAIGNHDDGDNGLALEYRVLFGDQSLNYFFDYGKWRFVVIDNSSSVHTASQTLDWLEKVLAATPKDHSVIVSAHKPTGLVGKWAYHCWEPEEASARFHELMTRYKPKHVFFGHIHAYSTTTLDGVPYTITGGGGAPLHNRYGTMGNVHHYTICDVTSDGSLEQQVVRFYREQTDNRAEP